MNMSMNVGVYAYANEGIFNEEWVLFTDLTEFINYLVSMSPMF